MPRYRIRLINSEFESSDEADYPSLEKAWRSAIVGATQVVTESVAEGKMSVAVEVQIYEGEQLVARNVVSLNVADLSGGEQLAS
jgi:hypothetical protein